VTANAPLAACAQRGITLTPEGDGFRVRGPRPARGDAEDDPAALLVATFEVEDGGSFGTSPSPRKGSKSNRLHDQINRDKTGSVRCVALANRGLQVDASPAVRITFATLDDQAALSRLAKILAGIL
jgi:hypothetical protein